MKKIMTLMLCLLMLASLAACGSKKPTPAPEVKTEVAAVAVEEVQQPEETKAPEEITEPVVTEAPTEPAAAVPAFDSSWASNEFEALIPQLPLNMTGEQKSERRYKLSTEYDALKYYTGSAEYTALADYVATLEGYGFRVYPTNYTNVEAFGAVEPNAWIILDNQGNRIDIELMITSFSEEGLRAACYATIECTSGTVVDTAALGGVFAKLPDAVWTSQEEVTQTAGNLWTQYITYEAAAAYCDALLADGYTVAEEGEPYMSYIIKTFVAADGTRIAVQYEGREDFGSCNICINQG